jgi:hypothetical protein
VCPVYNLRKFSVPYTFGDDIFIGGLTYPLPNAISVAGRESGSRNTPNTPAVSLDVYEDYLKGRFALNRKPGPDLEASTRYFEAAIAKDASFAPAYSGLGAAHAVLSSPFGGDEPVDALAKAAQAAGRALELGATIGEAHFVLIRCQVTTSAYRSMPGPADNSASISRSAWPCSPPRAS